MPSVLITGANRGIGLEFVRQYADAGWRVFACCRNPDDATTLKTINGDISVMEMDVSNPERVKEIASSITEPLDVVVANAGNGG